MPHQHRESPARFGKPHVLGVHLPGRNLAIGIDGPHRPPARAPPLPQRQPRQRHQATTHVKAADFPNQHQCLSRVHHQSPPRNAVSAQRRRHFTQRSRSWRRDRRASATARPAGEPAEPDSGSGALPARVQAERDRRDRLAHHCHRSPGRPRVHGPGVWRRRGGLLAHASPARPGVHARENYDQYLRVVELLAGERRLARLAYLARKPLQASGRHAQRFRVALSAAAAVPPPPAPALFHDGRDPAAFRNARQEADTGHEGCPTAAPGPVRWAALVFKSVGTRPPHVTEQTQVPARD